MGAYDLFLSCVDQVKDEHGLKSGPVAQPNNVRALCTGDWKLVHYVHPNRVEADEWELYYLKSDPIEQTNLVDFRTGEVRNLRVSGLSQGQLKAKYAQLKKELAKQEAAIVG